MPLYLWRKKPILKCGIFLLYYLRDGSLTVEKALDIALSLESPIIQAAAIQNSKKS